MAPCCSERDAPSDCLGDTAVQEAAHARLGLMIGFHRRELGPARSRAASVLIRAAGTWKQTEELGLRGDALQRW
jgi:uncharacterized lipoprotein YbaY